MIFKDSLKSWFYHNDSNAAKADARVCLLDENGNPSRSDNVLRVLSYSMCKDDFVDMGLPSGTLWAKKNLGAVSETDYGMYCSWGNLELHIDGDGYNFSQATYNNTPAATINANLSLEQDIAHQMLGYGCKMPTREQFIELINSNNTDYVDENGNVLSSPNRVVYKGVTGVLLRSKVNGNLLFFPAAGRFDGGSTIEYKDMYLYYRTSRFVDEEYATIMYNNGGRCALTSTGRYKGLSIRPVI